MRRVLIVDDEKELAEVVAEQLAHAGYETGLAFDGVEAVLAVLDISWDIVLMDVRMPRLDGINALRIIRKLAPEVPVIMYSGQVGKADMIESIRLGAYACLTKPIVIDDVIKSISLVPGKKIEPII